MQKLSHFGHEFQVKLITCLLTDYNFSSRIFDILKADYFDSQALSWLCDVILKYYQEYKAVATMPVLKHAIEFLDDPLLKEEVINVLRSAVTSGRETDLQFIKDATLEFCKIQEVKYVMIEAVDLIKDGNLEEIKVRFDRAFKKGEDQNVGHDYLNGIDQRYVTMIRHPVTTGFSYIDELTQGGLSAGELGVIVGNGGSGKSWCLSSMCAKAMESGKNALFITLELDKEVVGVRIDCIFTGIEMSQLKYNQDLIKNKLERIKMRGGGTIAIEWYPSKKLSIVGVRALLDRMILLGNKPDVVYIDYADLMKLNSSKMKRKDEELQELYEELRGIAGEYRIPIWTVSQANRHSHDKETEFIGAGMIAESMGKHYTADFMMSLLRKEEDKISKTAKFHVIKNRLGEDGMSMMSRMDLKQGIIEIYKPNSAQHLQMEKNAAEGQVEVRKIMLDKHAEFFSEEKEAEITGN